jgi:HTH-type transcriptional regulator/antitoxin HigA
MTRIESEKQYKAAMARIEELLPLVTEDTPEDDIHSVELVLLSNLVADYDNEHYPIGAPSLIDVLRLRMYEMNLTQKAMAELIGISASRLSEILTGKREPTLQVARAICINLSIDANIVLGVC